MYTFFKLDLRDQHSQKDGLSTLLYLRTGIYVVLVYLTTLTVAQIAFRRIV